MTEDEIFDKHGKQCMHCLRNTLSPYEIEWTCFSSGYNAIKRKNELTRIQRKEN